MDPSEVASTIAAAACARATPPGHGRRPAVATARVCQQAEAAASEQSPRPNAAAPERLRLRLQQETRPEHIRFESDAAASWGMGSDSAELTKELAAVLEQVPSHPLAQGAREREYRQVHLSSGTGALMAGGWCR
jgi:hypothetical protein